MTRKDYIALAAALAEAHELIMALAPSTHMAVANSYVHAISKALQADNPRFDARRFHRAALPETVRKLKL